MTKKWLVSYNAIVETDDPGEVMDKFKDAIDRGNLRLRLEVVEEL